MTKSSTKAPAKAETKTAKNKVEETSSQESSSEELGSKELSSKELSSKEKASKEKAPKELSSKEKAAKSRSVEELALEEEKANPPGAKVDSLGKPNPDASIVRAHADAELTKNQVLSLYQRLIEEKNRVIAAFERRVEAATSEDDLLADEIDIAQRSTDQAWLFRMADKDRKLLFEIDAALIKMRDGEYGLCEGTDEPIGFDRLNARPWTRYSVDYKAMLEMEKKSQQSRG